MKKDTTPDPGGSSASPGHHLPRDMSVREVCDTGDRLCDVWPDPYTSWLLQQDNPAPPTTTHRVPATFAHTRDRLLIPQEGRSITKTAEHFCYQAKESHFSSWDCCCWSWLSSWNACFHTSHSHLRVTHPQRCPRAQPVPGGSTKDAGIQRMNDLDNCC